MPRASNTPAISALIVTDEVEEVCDQTPQTFLVLATQTASLVEQIPRRRLRRRVSVRLLGHPPKENQS